MWKRSSLYFKVILLFLSHCAVGQSVDSDVLEQVLDQLVNTEYDERVDVDQFYENLIQYYQDGININEASANELHQLLFLNERQINNIIRYREYYGPLLSQYELAMIPALDHPTIEILLHFIEIGPVQDRKLNLKNRLQSATNKYVILRQSVYLEEKKGYSTDTLGNKGLSNAYEGSPQHLYGRFRISQPGSISLGLTVEKDAGEKVSWQPNQQKYGADFISAHFQLEKVGPIEQVILGDYTFQSGQQLIFGGGLGLGKSAMTVRSVGRSQQGVKPYTSSTENGFMRGLAVSWKLPSKKINAKISLLLSSQKRNASLKKDTTDRNTYFESFDLTGLYRNSNEIEKRRTLGLQEIGSNIHFSNKYQNFQMGVNLLKSKFNYTFIPADKLYKQHDFRGRDLLNSSVYVSYQQKHWYSFAEIAKSNQGEYAMVGGVNAVLNTYLESVWLYRNYSQGFYSLYGNAFGENSRNANEKGFYWGVKLEPLPRLELSAYYDLFHFPWLRYRVDAPSKGQEYLLGGTYQLDRNNKLSVQFRQEKKGINTKNSIYKELALGNRTNLIFKYEHILNEYIKLKTRLHTGNYSLSDSVSSGWVVAQDISYTCGRWKADTRFALINAKDYDNRQYLYENDVLYAFTVPAYSGQGVRYYALLRCKVNRHLSSWIRWGRTIFYDKETLGSSLEEIQDNKKTQLRLQLIYKF